MGRQYPNEDPRLTEYRRQVELDNLLGNLRVFCGGLGLLALFLLALTALLNGTEGALFAESAGAVLMRFGKFAFFLACLWGLLGPWCDYSDENAQGCRRRRQMLTEMEQDPDYWRKRDERKQQWKKEQEELQAKLAAMGIRPDSDYWEKALQRSHESLAALTRKLEGSNDQKTKL